MGNLSPKTGNDAGFSDKLGDKLPIARKGETSSRHIARLNAITVAIPPAVRAVGAGEASRPVGRTGRLIEGETSGWAQDG